MLLSRKCYQNKITQRINVSKKAFTLHQDKQGLIWDLMLYIPTVAALLGLSASFWFQNNPYLSYLLLFLGSFFAIAGTNRILKTRLMILPKSPIALEVNLDGKWVNIKLRSGQSIELIKQVKFFRDLSGKSVGLSGIDGTGRLQQFVFHKGQFILEKEYDALTKVFIKA
ncbi:hypothetical protein FV185_13400 [Ferrovum sp. PN-J185]|nr:hypothetical protein FV185_13400 [Ferrovum sp. PN-J185]